MEVIQEKNFHIPKTVSIGDKLIDDPFIKEFYAFCRINGIEKEAVKLLDKKIKEKKLAQERHKGN